MKYLLFLSFSIILLSCENPEVRDSKVENVLENGRDLYQIKVYSFKSDAQVIETDNYLKEAYIPALKKLGLKNIGVFKQKLMEGDSIKKTFVLTPFDNMEQLVALEADLSEYQQYLKAGEEYINASHEKPPFERIETIILRAFEDMPQLRPTLLDSPRSERIYELRSYESSTEEYFKKKVDMFNQGGEIRLFEQLEFNAVFYGEVISGGKMPNLMYMTTFSNQESRDNHWKAFVDSPEWKEMKSLPKYANTVSHIDIYFLYPTEYSDY